jgi:hypothetical protein
VPLCCGIEWVCESHPDYDWHAELGYMVRRGMPVNAILGGGREYQGIPEE